jgi:hypothetical protein
MGINALLKTADSEVIAEVLDPQNTLAGAANGAFAGTRLLRYLMPYGDAIFNQAQASDLANDITRVCSTNEGTILGDHLLEIRPLVDWLSSEIHVYLWFEGD